MVISTRSTHGQATVDAMTRFLIAPSPVFTELPPSDCASLRHCVSVCISNILKVSMFHPQLCPAALSQLYMFCCYFSSCCYLKRSKNSSMTKSTLFSFINVAQSTSNANPSCSLIIPNALSCIACTAPNLKSKEVNPIQSKKCNYIESFN